MEGSTTWAGLELRHLLALEAIAEQGSFHSAAAHLGYTQSAISQQIAALERIIGEELISRPGGSRPVRLTTCGGLLLRHARGVFAQMDAARADLAAVRAADEVRLRVGAFQSVAAGVLPEVLRQLANRTPPLPTDLTHSTSDDELFDALLDNRLDVIFAMRPIPDGPFATRDLFDDPFVVLTTKGSDLAEAGRTSLAALARRPLITAQTCRFLAGMEAMMASSGTRPNVRHRSDDNGTMAGLVAAGEGVALVPRLVADSISGDVVAVEIDEVLPPRRIVLAWREDRLLPPSRAEFVDVVIDACRTIGLGPRRWGTPAVRPLEAA